MPAQPDTHYEPASEPATGGTRRSPVPGGDESLLAALLDGMDAALCAFDAEGVVTHWNREAERMLGWSPEEAVGRRGLTDWAVRSADAPDVESRLLAAMTEPGRQVHEIPLLTKDGGRVLVRTQSCGVRDADGRPAGVYCAFSEVHAQIDLERSIALSEAMFDDASWGVVLIDADLRPAVVNAHAARTFGMRRSALLGRPLGDLLGNGLEELEGALGHVLAEGTPPAPADLWLTLRPHGDGPVETPLRRCWRSGFLRLSSPLAEEPVPLGVAWLFQDVTDAKLAEQQAARLRFRDSQLHRAARAAAECEDPMEAATIHLEFALAGYADHALLDLTSGTRLVRAAHAPGGTPENWHPDAGSGLPVPYPANHPALQAYEHGGPVRTGAGGSASPEWAAARLWPEGTAYGLSTVLRSRGRTLGVATFLRGPARRAFDRADTGYAQDIAVRVAAAVDLAQAAAQRR
ncbi:PAS domain-containing protein [Streptomyces sp. TRM 70351]|uniref:PAS domain-containing protein n=1 Tax=Streptomyces sp. TRM 70351 TaxID=3116552 RepID=UPI002E7AE117|nr:PAS domain-containing protein [Streptomyces sp. TRM 70351]MEE1929571.1 PAS domain-containing protein [Streptomyces sp. TRM 70351]